MKGIFLFAATLATMAVLAEEPPVAVTAQTYDAAERTLTVTYSLSCETPMIVTFDVLDDSGASIGAERIRNAYGEINRLVEPGKGKTFVWRTVAMGGGFSALSCKVQVKAWSPDDPPEVMVLDLFKDSANKYARAYYPSLESLPGGLTENLEYKTTKLVMKHVHRPVGGKWIMGSFNECSASDRGNEGQHEVTIAADYWLGVFELTQYQAVRINDGSDLNTQGGAYWQDGLGGKYGIRPLENTCLNFIRGATVYPTAPSTGSILGKLLDRSGYAFDFPSEAQWEYAARAGHAPGVWGDCSAMVLDGSSNPWTQGNIADPNLDRMACYVFNPAPTGGTMPVGSFKPNDWGFYDMHGNVSEMCIDYWVNDISAAGGAIQVKDGEQVGSDAFSIRGGSYEDTFFNCRPCLRNFKQARNSNLKTLGVRLYAPIAPAN